MARTERTSRSWLSWLNGWVWPFLWILLIPAVTVPWQMDLVGNGTNVPNCHTADDTDLDMECPVKDLLPTLRPGLLNLAAFVWLLSPRRRTRYAAAVAGTLGAVRLAVPAIIYVESGPTVVIPFLYPFVDEWSPVASFVLWNASLLATLVFVGLGKDSRVAPHPKG